MATGHFVNEHFDQGYTDGSGGKVYSPSYKLSQAERDEYCRGYGAGHSDRSAVRREDRKKGIPATRWTAAHKEMEAQNV